jgi:chorismate mutase
VLHENNLSQANLISIFFTATTDVTSEFAALAARELGLGDVPLMCSVEMDVQGAMPRVIRLMMHAETNLSQSEIQHIYLRGAAKLRTDLAQ